MIVSVTNRFIYIAVPRTGSTATFRALLPYGAAVVPYGKSPQWCYAGDTNGFHDPNIPAELQAYFTFAGVRNPYTHMVSHYLWAKSDENHRLHGLAMAKDFPGFVEMIILTRQLTTQAAFLGNTRIDTRIYMECGIGEQLSALPVLQPGPVVVSVVNDVKYDIPWYAYYNAAAIAMVRDWAADDFQKFGYSTDFGEAIAGLGPQHPLQPEATA
jgi:hypothetical protein